MHINKCLTFWFMFLLLIIETTKPNRERQLVVWKLKCELGMIADPECPIDGGWSPWSAWSPCQGACDNVGHRQRYRDCTNPAPAQDGSPCTGPDLQTEICYLTNCTVNDFRKLVFGDSVRMKALHYLEAAPALMERCLQIECAFEAMESFLNNDNTWQLNSESLWNALQCVKHNLGCPIAGEWGAWGTWSECGARCGPGHRWRYRKCDTPPPSDGNLVCTGFPLQLDDCIGDQCAITSHESRGNWGEWGAWSPCSEKCGPGVKHRRRLCRETNKPSLSGTWGTHCRGQHDELTLCESPVCNLDGGWSGWGVWGPCSKTCGAGKRSRTRSCTRPIPVGKGAPCVGIKTEIGSCHLAPCEGFARKVAMFQGESYLHYNFTNKRATFFHFYIRFMPFSPHCTLVRRGTVDGPYVRLSLQKWHVCLEACGSNRPCCLPCICSHNAIESATWHTILITITNEGAALRLDDAPVSIRSAWPCDPDLPDNKLNIFVGEKLQGQIQEIIMNFVPLPMMINKKPKTTNTDFHPISASNVAYDKASTTEAYLRIKNDHYLRIPCFRDENDWMLELTLKPKKEVGTILLLKNDNNDNWLHVNLLNTRLQFKVEIGGFRFETSSTTECPPGRWLDVTLAKKSESNHIEANINDGERIILFLEDIEIDHKIACNETGYKYAHIAIRKIKTILLCTDEFFIGGVPNEVQQHISEEVFTPFLGVLASIRLNKEYLDLHDHSLERFKDNKIQVSSKTASVSGSYHETSWGKSNRLNLTCLHARTARTPHIASWFFLDTSVTDVLKDKTLRSIDDGRVLKLVASADNDLRGFYTCRAHRNRRTRNIVTYGVLGQVHYKLHSPDLTTAIACMTTFGLVLGTLSWLILEGIHDLRNGYGFFRDAHLSPDEEAEAVCKYIDDNIHLIGSKKAAAAAKAHARRRAKLIAASQTNFAAQEPQGLIKESLQSKGESQSDISEPEGIPTLPNVASSDMEPKEICQFQPCYVSSPRHGSITTQHTRMSTSSFELVSPRALCSKLLRTKSIRSSKESLSSKSKDKLRFSVGGKLRSSLVTIKSSSYIHPQNAPLAQRILQKFQDLKCDDFD